MSGKASSYPGSRPGSRFDADDTLMFTDRPARRACRKAAALAGLAMYAGYLVYRCLYTLNPEQLTFSLVVYLAEVHGFFFLAFFYFQIWEVRQRTVPPAPPDLLVDVFITADDEDVDLLRQVVRGALQMRGPHRTFVLDAGRRSAVKALCDELVCEYIGGNAGEPAAAGQWNRAFARTSGALVATFDGNHVPRADFLERTLGFFADPAVAVVNVPARCHHSDSLQPPVDWRQRRIHGERDLLRNLVMPGQDHWNASVLGSGAAVLRREALEPHGALLTGTSTGRLHTSVVLHADGWKSVYVNEALVTGLAPIDSSGYARRLRQSRAGLEIIRHTNPLTRRGLTFAQRICYAVSMLQWTIGFPKLVFYLAPPIILFSGRLPFAQVDGTFAALCLAHLLSVAASFKVLTQGKGRLLMDDLFDLANSCAMMAVPARSWFESDGVITGKPADGHDDRALLLHHALILFTVTALIWSALTVGFGLSEHLLGTAIAGVWALCNVALLTILISFARRSPVQRHAVRFGATIPVELLDVPANGWLGVTVDLAETGCTLLWPRALPVGTCVKLRLHLGPQQLECDGEVVSLSARVQGDWVGHGIRFRFANQPAVDRFADALYNLAIPEPSSPLTQPSRMVRAIRSLLGRIAAVIRLRAPRYEARLPIRVQTRDGREWLATTRDLSHGGLSVISPSAVDPGRVVRVILRSPEGEWTSLATVVRRTALPAADERVRMWQLGLRVDLETNLVQLRHILSAEAAL